MSYLDNMNLQSNFEIRFSKWDWKVNLSGDGLTIESQTSPNLLLLHITTTTTTTTTTAAVTNYYCDRLQAVAQVVETLCCKQESRGFEIQWGNCFLI
jgi:hypothetical protein